jgi:hypothetical protein
MSGKRQKIQHTQLRLAFAEGSRGEPLGANRRGIEPLTAKQTPESPAGKERLMEEVCDRHNLEAAGSPTGFWRMSGHPAVQQPLRNRYFDSIGLPHGYLRAGGVPHAEVQI